MTTLTREETLAVESLLNDDLAYISTFMDIPDKNRTRRKFIPWPVQRRLVESLTGRDVVVKDAQIGCTSIITAVFQKHTITVPDTTTVIVSHEEFLTQRLLHRTQVFYDSIPKDFRVVMDRSSASEKRFPDINSVMYIGTARAQVFGRGEPIHRLLFSEEAFYVPDAYRRIMIPAMQRVPPTGMIVRESTPNGEDGSFYEEVQACLKNESTYTLHCLYWWENPDNTLSLDSPPVVVDPTGKLRGKLTYTPDEQALIKAHDLAEDQIRWRRWKILESGDLFYQEHLESLDTCFLTVGAPHYDPHITMALSKGCYAAPYSGPEGAKVWFQPEEGGSYVEGVDPGMGKQSESVAHIWRTDLDHVRHEATLSGLYEPVPMAQKCAALARYYNNALIVPEANAHGLALIAELHHNFGRSLRLYHRRDIISGVTGMYPGWLTTARTKPFMMQELTARLSTLETHDAEFVRQVRSFRDLGMGKVGTIGADDHHDAGCLSLVGAIGLDPSRRRGFVGSSGWAW